MGSVRLELVGFNRRNRDRWVESVASRLARGTRILDVGAGECPYRAFFSHCDYKAQDFARHRGTSEGLLQETWDYGALDYVCDATSIPVDDGTFDAVLCTEVLEHVPEPVEVLREIARVLRPGGQAFISAPLGSALHQQPHHFYGGFTPYFYEHFLPGLGLRVDEITANGHFFRLLLQELNRGAAILQARETHRGLHPMRLLIRAIISDRTSRWLTNADERLTVEEFTVGYHIEATRV